MLDNLLFAQFLESILSPRFLINNVIHCSVGAYPKDIYYLERVLRHNSWLFLLWYISLHRRLPSHTVSILLASSKTYLLLWHSSRWQCALLGVVATIDLAIVPRISRRRRLVLIVFHPLHIVDHYCEIKIKILIQTNFAINSNKRSKTWYEDSHLRWLDLVSRYLGPTFNFWISLGLTFEIGFLVLIVIIAHVATNFEPHVFNIYNYS